MKAAFIHTDLRLYWPGRLKAFRTLARAKQWELGVVELSGKGSPYAFAQRNSDDFGEDWRCLFQDRGPEAIAPCEARRAVCDCLDAMNPDAVVACGGVAYYSGAAALYWGRRKGRPVVLLDNARLADVPRGRVTTWIKRRLYANASAMMIPAPAYQTDYLHWGFREEQLFYGLNVVDNADWAAKAESARAQGLESLRKERGLPDRFFLGVGRQIEKKNWIGAIKAFSDLSGHKVTGEWGLALVGDGPERSRLEEYSRESGVKNVRFLPFAEPSELAQYYALADCLVLPSFGETWGLVVNEAMACGCPVLISKQCGCASTLVKEGENGWTFDATSPQELAQRMVTMASLSDDGRRRMGEASRRIIADWGLDRFCQGLLAAIEYALRCPRLRPGLIDRALLRLWKGRYRPV